MRDTHELGVSTHRLLALVSVLFLRGRRGVAVVRRVRTLEDRASHGPGDPPFRSARALERRRGVVLHLATRRGKKSPVTVKFRRILSAVYSDEDIIRLRAPRRSASRSSRSRSLRRARRG